MLRARRTAVGLRRCRACAIARDVLLEVSPALLLEGFEHFQREFVVVGVEFFAVRDRVLVDEPPAVRRRSFAFRERLATRFPFLTVRFGHDRDFTRTRAGQKSGFP